MSYVWDPDWIDKWTNIFISGVIKYFIVVLLS